MSLDARLRGQLDALAADGLHRALPAITTRMGVQYRLGGAPVVGFCSNDYLGLADRIPEPAAPSGAASSRLVCGDLALHRRVERRLADLAGYPDAVLFPSGFQLNVGVLPSILSSKDIVHSDRLNHASIIDGLRLSAPRPTIVPHAQAPRFTSDPEDAQQWWVSETIFSMDGDTANLDALHDAAALGVCTYLDDAHGLGLFANGRGWPQHHGFSPTLYVGTLSKAFGCAGAFVAASSTVCEWIRTRARSFVFSTGSSPRVVAAIDAALDLVTGDVGDQARARLQDNIRQLARALRLPKPPSSPIFPVVVGDNARTVDVAARLIEQGFHVQAIRPPTVPQGTARLRITLSAEHTSAQIDGLVEGLREVLGPSLYSTRFASHP